MRSGILLFICLMSIHTQAIDLNFRYKEGYCQRGQRAGYNPNFWGECGNVSSSHIVNRSYNDINLRGSVFNSAYIYNLRFNKGNLNGISIKRVILMQSTFTEVSARRWNLRGSIVKGVTFDKSILKRWSALGTRFVRVQFINSDLTNSIFTGAHFQETDFINCDLRGANLAFTSLLFANFTHSKFDKKTKLPFSEEEALKRGMVKVD